MSFQMTGFRDMKQRIKDLSAQMRNAAEEFLPDAGEQVRNVAYNNCPKDEVKLANSLRVVKSGVAQGRDSGGRFTSEARMGVSIEAGGPGVPHAAAVHENPGPYDPPSWQGKSVHFRVGGPKFIERALQSEAGWILTGLAKKVLPRVIVIAATSLVFSTGLGAQSLPEDEPPQVTTEDDQKSDQDSQQIGVFAAVWCKVIAQKKEAKVETFIDPDTGEPVEEPQPDQPESENKTFKGCDAGFAASLVHFGRLHLVAVIGTSSVGTGFAWSITKVGVMNRPMAVAIGVMANYNSDGIYSDSLALTLGATVSLRGAP